MAAGVVSLRDERNTPMSRRVAGIVLSGVVLFFGCTRSQAPAPAASALPVPLALSVNAEMVGLVDHAAHALWEVEREGHAPKSDEDWTEVEDSAVQLAASGTLIALGGTGPADPGWAQLPDWKTLSRELRDAALAARTAAQGKNLEALVRANGQIVDVCESCHKAFKPQLPTEKILHRHRSP
jgi:Cytochrome C'